MPMESDEETIPKKGNKDTSGSFYDFQKLCAEIGNEPGYGGKTAIVKKFVQSFTGDVYLVCRLLLCREDKRVYNMKEKAFIKVVSPILGCPAKDMLQDFEKGDMGETAKKFFVASGQAQKRSILTLKQVNEYLDRLTTVTKEDEQNVLLAEILEKCTGDDIKILWKIIDHDLKINIGAKFVLAALHTKAWDAYLKSNNLQYIVDKCLNGTLDKVLSADKEGKMKKTASTFAGGISLHTPIKPMLAKATKSAADALKKLPGGMYAEIKYDGERIQIHKQGNTFKFFSRNLKPIMEWKVKDVKEFIPKATKATDVIFDGEILLMDTKERKPLPFGTLGIHKAKAFSDATVCVFLFDILYLEGVSLLNTPLEERREILQKNVKIIPNRVELSEMQLITDEDPLTLLMSRCIREGLEGLVLKGKTSVYQPSARHWLKIKKDYLQGMADSADLLVLGGYYGTGNKGGLLSVFLMGVYDEESGRYKTVCKVGNGHDDDMIKKLQPEMLRDMVKIESDKTRVPSWLDVDPSLVPYFVMKDPKKSAVWEIEGAEFSASNHHTAAGISIRFPRVVKIRHDKDWSSHTTLQELKELQKASKHEPGKKLDAKKKTKDEDGSDDAPKPKKKAAKPKQAPKPPPKFEEEENEEDDQPAEKMKVEKEESEDDMDVEVDREPGVFKEIGGKSVCEPTGNSPAKIIAVFCNDGGKWSQRGIFGALSKRWKDVDFFGVKSPSLKDLGDIYLQQVESGEQTIYVARLIVQASRLDGAFQRGVFSQALAKLRREALKKKADVHFAKLSDVPNLDWNNAQSDIKQSLVNGGVNVTVYSLKKEQLPVEEKQKRSLEEIDAADEAAAAKKQKTQPSDNFLKGVVALLSPPNEEVKKKLESMGGRTASTWKTFGEKTTHLICSAENDDFLHVSRLGGTIVTADWIRDCHAHQQKLAPSQYLFKGHEVKNEKTEMEKIAQIAPTEKFSLTDIFEDTTIYVEDEHDAQLRRYIVAYGGDLVDNPKVAKIIIASDPSKFAEFSEAIIEEPRWVWNKINNS
eukprot:TRINITY_DN5843_c0_g1_i1.p1 TRINITY_DN5843_c0_g1~~TRINITY_DN5843_c0_g1_i1.p1  ORF type:complete len:1034 (+),score=331.86 TRINITY_DN5843_c0_g1_i1:101-3202(+)